MVKIIFVQGPELGKADICEPILRSLPDWFGIEESTQQYAKDIDIQPTFLAYVDDAPIGFLTLKENTPFSSEIHVMGVYTGYHRVGIGKALIEKAQLYLRDQGVEYLQVKTLSGSHPDPFYARTRAFYFAMGFRPIAELSEIWGPNNPCLLMIKYLSK